MAIGYAYQGYRKDTMARAMGVGLEISFRDSVEMSRFIRGMPLKKARRLLSEILEKKRALPLGRHHDSRGHKPGMGPGRYPEKTTREFIALLRDLEANAVQKGMSGDLVLVHVTAKTAPTRFHYGRLRRRRHKGAHVEMVAAEVKGVGKSLEQAKSAGSGRKEKAKVQSVQQAGKEGPQPAKQKEAPQDQSQTSGAQNKPQHESIMVTQ